MSLVTRITAALQAIKGDFDALDARVAVLEGAPSGSDPWTYIRLASNLPVTTTGINDSGLSFAPPPNSLVVFEGQLFLQSAVATIGPRPGLNWPSAGVLQNVGRVEVASGATGATLRFWGAPSFSNAAATAIATANESWFGQVQGTVVTGPSVTGNVTVTLATETANNEVRLMANSWLRWRTVS